MIDMEVECLYTQVMEFSHHVGDLDNTEVLAKCQELAYFYVARSVDNASALHLVVWVMTDPTQLQKYVCIFADILPKIMATMMA